MKGLSRNSDDSFNVSSWSCFFDNVKGDSERSEQLFGATVVPFRCGGDGKECCGEMSLGNFMGVSGSEWGESMGTK